MKLLVTGPPRTGKTTLIKSLIASRKPEVWAYCREVTDTNTQRVGFEAYTSHFSKQLFAHKELIESERIVGAFHVDTDAVDVTLTATINQAQHTISPLIFDEIGRMQMLSQNFSSALDELFASDINLIATIHDGDAWTKRFIDIKDTSLLSLNNENSGEITKILEAFIDNVPLYDKLNAHQRMHVATLAKQYAKNNDLVQLQKLFGHALDYVVNHRVSRVQSDEYEIQGKHGKHIVVRRGDKLVCDCDLFNGQKQYHLRAGECSHIQAITITAK